MHRCMGTSGQILDTVGPYRVSGEPTVLYFVWFYVDGVKMWDTTSTHPYVPGGAVWWVVAVPSQHPPLVTI